MYLWHSITLDKPEKNSLKNKNGTQKVPNPSLKKKKKKKTGTKQHTIQLKLKNDKSQKMGNFRDP